MESAAAPREYEVLYFKRKNKVHKSKGVSKVDGRLVVQGDFVKLYEGNTGNNDTKQEIPIHSSRNAEIAKRVFHVDEEVILGQYSVEIVSAMHLDVGKGITVKPGATSILVQKSVSNTRARPVTKPNVLKSSKPATTGWLQNRRPPAQPKLAENQAPLLDDSNDASEGAPQCTLPLLDRKEVRLPATKRTSLSGQKRKLTTLPAPASATDTLPSRLATPLAGAIGTLILPPSLRAIMRPHQVSGVVYLWNCLTGASPNLRRIAERTGVERTPRGAILADSMGMGKTLMTVAIVFAIYRRSKQQRFIIVCPSSLVQNWAREFDKWLGRASLPKRVVVKKGGQDGLKVIRGFVPIKPNQSEILIISYDLFRMNSSILTEAKQVGLLVVDEGHRLKNSSGSITMSALNNLDCEARLLITGTPVQNNLSEFHAVANFVCPGILGALADFRRDFERPITTANRKDATPDQRRQGAEQAKALDNVIKAFLLRRLAKDVLSEMLPPRTELLLFCRPSLMQCDLYRKITRTISDPLSTLTILRKLCSHPDLLESSADSSTSRGGVSDSGKLFLLQKLLDEIRLTSPDDKVVVVSCFTSILTMIEDKLIKPKAWGYKRLDGSTAQSNRQPLVDGFNRMPASQCFVFLLSSKAGGMGLNLVGANRLIMFDADFNPAIDAQAMARIYRPGQTKPTTIYRLFTAGTMEETVLQRQEQKGSLATVTVDGSLNSESGKFTNEELRDCFTLKEDTCCDTKSKMKSLWPEYNGSKSLSSQGCTDPVILNLADDCAAVLRHVHVVPMEASSTNVDMEPIMDIDDLSAHDTENELPMDPSDEEEFEFDG